MSNLPKESSLEGPDILIVTMPKVEPDAPTIGPSLLKSHLLANGFSCETLDLNIKLYNHLKKKGLEHHYYRENDIVFALREGTYSAEFLEFFAAESEFFKAWVSSIKARRPKVVGLSFLTSFSNAVGFKFSEMLREEMPEVAILWGGPQVGIEIDLAKIEATCDHHISGDAENAVVDFMRSLHDSEPFEDRGAVQLEDLKGVLLPDYSDVDWSEYYSHKNFADMAYVTATRGCVKACSFCNVYKIWPKYLMRPTGGVADEIKLLIEDHGRKSIYFTDSLLNGSRKHFRNLMSEMKVLKQEQPDLKWEAQWVLKPRHIMPEDDFQLL
ncbi:MAG: cobalamin B12-binding domain-containing protein, partial [Bdellovibrionales bacterium]|nr:cobalamin B12-binding domain-containing protein [Bdellovibrionales bacterium]